MEVLDSDKYLSPSLSYRRTERAEAYNAALRNLQVRQGHKPGEAVAVEDDIEIHMYEEMDLNRAMLIESFPTVGLVSTIVASYIVDTLKLRRVGSIISKRFPPAAVVHNGEPTPPMRIYAGPKVCGPNNECDQVVVLTSEFTVADDLQLTLARRILGWAKDQGVKYIVSVEGTGISGDPQSEEDTQIYCACSTDKAWKYMQGYKVSPLKMGIVTGLSGVLLYIGNMEGRDIVCLLSPAHTNFPDARAAARLIHVIDDMLPLVEIDTGPLLEEAVKIEQNIQTALETMRKGLESRKRVDVIPTPHMYG